MLLGLSLEVISNYIAQNSDLILTLGCDNYFNALKNMQFNGTVNADQMKLEAELNMILQISLREKD